MPGALLLLLACSRTPASDAPPAPPPAAVPAAPPGVLLLDAGHGAPGNPGNTNWACEEEQAVMRRLADAVATHLETKGLAVRRTRPDHREVTYDDRMSLSEGAAWFVSLHSDARAGTASSVHPQTGCLVVEGAPGFSVLWSDEGTLAPARLDLARAIARRMVEAGFQPYGGVDYAGLYAPDEVPGVFVDRHAPDQRIRFLRRPAMPSVIVETHQAQDPVDAQRWEQPATRAAFADALLAALRDVSPG